MDSEPDVDPRRSSLRPTQEEIDAWAEREHARRIAWLAGPSDDETREWARRYRWRAALGLEESRLGPAPEEITAWAEREHRRREAWRVGPTDVEKRRWAGEQRARAAPTDDPAPPPSPDEVDAWAAHEKERRERWCTGPSEDEKLRWAARQSGGVFDDVARLSAWFDLEFPDAQEVLRDVELAGKGALYSLSRLPRAFWAYLIRAGNVFEDELHRPTRRGRVPY